MVLVTALQTFVADLLHRAYASKSDADRSRYNSAICIKQLIGSLMTLSYCSFSPSSSAKHAVQPADVRRSIVTTSHFDFLTNRQLARGSPANGDDPTMTTTTTTIKLERQ